MMKINDQRKWNKKFLSNHSKTFISTIIKAVSKHLYLLIIGIGNEEYDTILYMLVNKHDHV